MDYDDTDTNSESTSSLLPDSHSESEPEKSQSHSSEIRISSYGSRSRSHHNLGSASASASDEPNIYDQKNGPDARKQILRQSRSSRTRSIHSDDGPYDMETFNQQKTTLRSGIGDQPDHYDSFEDEAERSRSETERHESEPKIVNVKTKNSVGKVQKLDSNANILEPVEKDPRSSIPKLKIRRYPSSLYDDDIVSPKEDTQERSKEEIAMIHVDKPKERRKTENVIQREKIVPSSKNQAKVEANTPLVVTSYFSNIGKPRPQISIPKTVHMAVGIKFIRSHSVRKHTCAQEFRKMFSIPEKERQRQIRPKSGSSALKKSSNVKGDSFSGKNNDISGIIGNNIADDRKLDYKLKSRMGTRTQDLKYSPLLSHSASYTPPNPLCGHTNINKYTRVNSPNTPFTRQFESRFPRP